MKKNKILAAMVCLLLCIVGAALFSGCKYRPEREPKEYPVYSVRFDCGTEEVKVKKATSDPKTGKVTRPADPKRAGYTFFDWYEREDGEQHGKAVRIIEENGWEYWFEKIKETQAPFDFGRNYGRDRTAYAVWKPIAISYIYTLTLPGGTNGIEYTPVDLGTATGGYGAIKYKIDTKSRYTGLSVSAEGILSGTPTANPGEYQFKVFAKAANGATAECWFRILIAEGKYELPKDATLTAKLIEAGKIELETNLEEPEYFLTGGDWRDSNIFENLTSGVEYTFFARRKGNGCFVASDAISITWTAPEGVFTWTPLAEGAHITGLTDFGRTLTRLEFPNKIDGLAVLRISTPSSGSEPKDDQEFKHVKSVTVAEGIRFIDNYSFYNWTNLEKIVLPDSLEDLPANCFKGCENLKEIKASRKVLELPLQQLCLTYFGSREVLRVNWKCGNIGTAYGHYYDNTKELCVREDETYSMRTLETIFHEFRHFYHYVAVYGFSDLTEADMLIKPTAEQKELWREGYQSNIDPDVDYEGYWYQVLEVDARAFAETFTGIHWEFRPRVKTEKREQRTDNR